MGNVKKISLQDLENKFFLERKLSQELEDRVNIEREIARTNWRNYNKMSEFVSFSPSAAAASSSSSAAGAGAGAGGAGGGGGGGTIPNQSINSYVVNDYIDNYFV